MRRAHLVVGLGFVAVFISTGIFMRLRFPAAYEGDATMRMLYRSAHIYILLSALMNVVAGIHMPAPSGRLQRIGSMLLGYYDATSKLRYAGRVGTGLVGADHQMLIELFSKHKRSDRPFADSVPGPGVRFLDPAIVIEVEYRRWPADGMLQHAAYKGVRFDKSPQDVRRETTR